MPKGKIVEDRRAKKIGRRIGDRPQFSVATLGDDSNFSEQEEVRVGGKVLSMPASFGSGGEEHRMSFISVSPEGHVVAFRH